jgi:hypothetical protein
MAFTFDNTSITRPKSQGDTECEAYENLCPHLELESTNSDLN